MSQMDLSRDWDEVIRGLNAPQEVETAFSARVTGGSRRHQVRLRSFNATSIVSRS